MSDTLIDPPLDASARKAPAKKAAAKKVAAKKAATAEKVPAKKIATPRTKAAVEPVVETAAPPVAKPARKTAAKAPIAEAAFVEDAPAPVKRARKAAAPKPEAPVSEPAIMAAPRVIESAPSPIETPISASDAPRSGAPAFERPPRPPYEKRDFSGPRPAAAPTDPNAPPDDRKNFRKSWKQRKFEKYLKRKQEREDRMRAEGIDPATAPRPERPERTERAERPERGPRPPYPQDRRERPTERDWEMERDRGPDPNAGPPEPTAGLLEISPKGFGFIRLKEKNFAAIATDTFVSPEMVRKYGLRDGVWMEGDFVKGFRGPQLSELRSVNGLPPDHYRQLPIFEELTAINPNKRYILETDDRHYTTRLVDMIAPIGRGQRGLIVAAPRAGKTTFLEHMALAILKNHPTTKLIVLLVDERPEEVTELTRALQGAEIMASSNDQDPRAHVRMAQLAIERAKRFVEAGEHVFMLMDSITRLARAFNQALRGGGKAMSGGIDSRALEMPRKIFAAARNTREAGSLTIIATALIETNSKGDDLIFQEFKGTGNMELVLDRKIAQQYIYPAVDIFKSGTRREELLLPPYQLDKINIIRRGLAGHKPVEAVERLIHFLNRFPNNNELLANIGTKNG